MACRAWEVCLHAPVLSLSLPENPPIVFRRRQCQWNRHNKDEQINRDSHDSNVLEHLWPPMALFSDMSIAYSYNILDPPWNTCTVALARDLK